MLKLGSVLRAQLGLQALRIFQQITVVYLLVRTWGGATYGDWVVLMSAATFFTMTDIGLQTVLSNQGLALSRKEDTGKLSELIGQFLGFYLIFVPLMAVLSIVGVVYVALDDVARTTLLTGEIRKYVFVSLLLSFLLGIPLSVLGSVYAARGNVAKGIDCVSIQVLAQTALIVVVLQFGGSVVAVALTYPITALLSLAWVISNLSCLYPGLSLRPNLAGAIQCLMLVRVSIYYFMNPFAGFFAQNVPVFFFADIKGTSSVVAVFAATRTLAGLLRQLTTQISNAVGVEIIRRWMLGETKYCRELFLDANRFSAALCGLLAGFIFSVSTPFIALWTQGKIVADPDMTAVLVVTVCAAGPAFLPLALLQSGNRPQLLSLAVAVQGGASVLIAFALAGTNRGILLLALLGFCEFLVNLIVTLYARTYFPFIRKADIAFAYLICALAGAFSLGTTTILLWFVPHGSILMLFAVGALAVPPLAIGLFLLGLTPQVRNKTFGMICTWLT